MSIVETPASVVCEVKDDGLYLSIPTAYLKRAFQLGLTTGVAGTVADDAEMLAYFSRAIQSPEDGSEFGRFVDSVCSDAIENGESFVSFEDEEF